MLKLIHLLILRNVAFYSFLYRVILAYSVAKKMNLLFGTAATAVTAGTLGTAATAVTAGVSYY